MLGFEASLGSHSIILASILFCISFAFDSRLEMIPSLSLSLSLSLSINIVRYIYI